MDRTETSADPADRRPRETATVRVFHPDPGRITLRTESDWERDLEPVEIGADGTMRLFRLEASGHWLYFKPVLHREGRAHWSQGENYLVLAGGGEALDVYPSFFEAAECSVCELMQASPGAGAEGEHRYRVFLPPGYHENTLRRYPVLYMHDGQNLFFEDEAFLGQTWKTRETLEVLTTMNALCGVIVVGIHPNRREREYTQPGYESYGRFLVEILKPRIDAAYRTMPGPESTGVMGSSLGGVVSFHLGWRWPQVFGKVACLSSTFGWRDDLMERVAGEEKRPIAIYLDSGWPMDNYEATRSMRDHLIGRGYRSGEDLLYLAFPRARHRESDWSARCHIPLQFLFGAPEKKAVVRP